MLFRSSKRLTVTADNLKNVTRKAAKFGIAVMTTAVVASVKAFTEFDDAMNQSLAIMGNVSDTMRGQMTAAAREIGRTTRLSAKDAAESFFFLASAGLDAEQSTAALPQVAAFAQAGMFNMAVATDLATDAERLRRFEQEARGRRAEPPQHRLRLWL